MPALVAWDWGWIQAQVFEGIDAPAGYYQKNHLNTGSNIWTFDHNAAFTIKLPENNELSTNLGYMNNTQNHATHYTNGDELHFDYMLGHYFENDVALGVVGSYYQQVTADHAPADILARVSSAADTLGPIIMYTLHHGRKETSVSLKWLHEYDVQGRLPQDYILWRVDSAF
jgi:hypothetical protein